MRKEKEEPEARHPRRGEAKHTQDDESQQEATPARGCGLLEMRLFANFCV
jgi:hypothetical protein